MILCRSANGVRYATLYRIPATQHCRRFSLFQIISQSEAHGQHKVKTLSLVDKKFIKDPKDIEFELWSRKAQRLIKKMTVEEALEEHIKPGFALAPFEHPNPQARKNEGPPTRFEIVELKLDQKPAKPSLFKIVVLMIDSPASHVRARLQSIYTFFKQKQQVEFHIRGSKKWKILTEEQLSFIVNQCIHLRPDVLLKAMPEGATMTIAPITDMKKVMWGAKGRITSGDILDGAKHIFRKRRIQFEREELRVGFGIAEERRLYKAEQREREGRAVFGTDRSAGSLRRAKEKLDEAKKFTEYLEEVRRTVTAQKPPRSGQPSGKYILDKSEKRAALRGTLEERYPRMTKLDAFEVRAALNGTLEERHPRKKELDRSEQDLALSGTLGQSNPRMKGPRRFSSVSAADRELKRKLDSLKYGKANTS